MTKIGLTSLDTVKKASVKIFFKLLFETRVARGILCPLQKIMMAEVIGHIQLAILRICGKKIRICGNVSISTTTAPMDTKLGKVVTYKEGLPPIKSHDPLIT